MLAAQSNIWQTLFALALKPTLADARLAVQLTDVLRVWHFLQLLDKDLGNDLGEQRVRDIVLRAASVSRWGRRPAARAHHRW
ncbi:hypothetical protein [Collimonas sp.]|uniref:hypothetical protein n=1 Tax=Collimonas sp. TaxID=1963772 RepID=UPI002CEF8B2E|nr:hypothetical protein [Collimonas sp.]HWX01602.1 hypothetical protein [Collimonas sp.]